MSRTSRYQLYMSVLSDICVDGKVHGTSGQTFGLGPTCIESLDPQAMLLIDSPCDTATVESRLGTSVDAILNSMAGLLGVPEADNGLDEDIGSVVIRALNSRKKSSLVVREDIDQTVIRIGDLVNETKQLCTSLHERLADAAERFPPSLSRNRQAENELLATTIEASLIKLSLIRNRCHHILYGTNDMADALMKRHDKVWEEERRLQEQEAALDNQLLEYDHLLALIDGGVEGGFRQVLDDWSLVQKETDECRKDLRRLGWSGD